MVFELAHQLGLVPLIAMLLIGRGLPRAYWLVALAFAVSWVADSIAAMTGGRWDAMYFWLPAQFALVFAAVAPTGWLLLWLWALALVMSASLFMSAPDPDWFVTLAGSMAVLMLARGPLALPLAAYFGAGTLGYFWMLATLESGVMPAWYAYQACRLIACSVFIGVVIHQGGYTWAFWRPKCYPASSS
jgi:hypothetical protein